MTSILFEDILEVSDLNPGVDRIVGETEGFNMKIIFDANCQLFQAQPGDKIRILISTCLDENGAPDTGEYNPNLNKESTLADQFEYVMYGKIYKLKDIEHQENGQTSNICKFSVFISFGGLLMNLTGDMNQLYRFTMDQQVYLLLKKISN